MGYIFGRMMLGKGQFDLVYNEDNPSLQLIIPTLYFVRVSLSA